MVDQSSQNSDFAPARRWRLPRPDLWSVGALLIAAMVLMPLVAVGWIALTPRENIWPHLVATTLPRYLGNSLILMFAVGLGSALIGTGAAWLVVMTRFPLRKHLDWALLMPLAIPAYIGAYALVDLLEYAGPVQTGLRSLFGWTDARDYWFPEIRSLPSACLVLTLSLYPYVYLLARAAFREQSVCALEVSRALGCGPVASFLRVALPLARPAIAAGAAIAMMETLNDFGTVDYFAVQTLTTGIFTTWLESYNAGGAAQIACVMLTLVLLLAALERVSRRNRRFHQTSKRVRPIEGTDLTGWRAALALVACLLPVLAGFVLPVGVILNHALSHLDAWADPALWRAGLHTLGLGLATAAVTVLAALFMVYGVRQSGRRLPRLLMPVTTIGYAAPGAVLAIGILIPFAALDHRVADLIEGTFGVDPGLLLTGSAAAMVLAYVVRFFAIGQGAVDSAMGRVTPSMDMAARSLGRGRMGALAEVHVPLIRGSVATAVLLIFVDTTKELPATLILRPFNFDTLATRVYGQASLENLGAASPAALAVILVGLLPVLLLIYSARTSWRR
ncbi:ABC transporter permease [Oceanomicrobium pacificus]|uniref:ABC transporter permease subunit n=1 Tax=Oceanomicrobium pacificus TaxID=2692916 RepID=A0A6B0TS67_9RHOB|nr:iron ABC transporter permease [Oceanomicrobium pacificus]MXU65579.1 ABC transporter permease subunit [Oceanomicrobium pacificus]